MAELIRYEYLSDTNGALMLVKLDDGRYAVNWGGYVGDDEVFYPSDYICTVYETLAAAEERFEKLVKRNRR